jgi:hypothetical protein
MSGLRLDRVMIPAMARDPAQLVTGTTALKPVMLAYRAPGRSFPRLLPSLWRQFHAHRPGRKKSGPCMPPRVSRVGLPGTGATFSALHAFAGHGKFSGNSGAVTGKPRPSPDDSGKAPGTKPGACPNSQALAPGSSRPPAPHPPAGHEDRAPGYAAGKTERAARGNLSGAAREA